VQTAVVWHCPDCGGIDAPQPCIGVCIWRPAEWIDAACYEQERSRAAAVRQAEQSLAGLLGRLAFTTPRAGQWERSLRALSSPGTEHPAFSLTGPPGSPVPLEEEAGHPGPGKPGPPLLGPSPLTAAAPGEHLSFGKNPPQCRNPKIASSNIRPAPVNEAIAPQNAICPTLPNAYAFSSSPRSVSSRNTNKRCSARYRHWPFRCIKPRALPPA